MKKLFVLFFTLILQVAASQSFAAPTLPAPHCKEFPGSRFKPCICARDVPAQIQFRTTLPACNGKAAAILKGSYANSFSVVLRDSQNRDRWPSSGYNGCSATEVALGLNKCSAFKCQKVLRSASQQICCFGEAGTSRILAGATRMTVKFRDVPNAGNDPLARICLNKFSAKKNLN